LEEELKVGDMEIVAVVGVGVGNGVPPQTVKVSQDL